LLSSVCSQYTTNQHQHEKLHYSHHFRHNGVRSNRYVDCRHPSPIFIGQGSSQIFKNSDYISANCSAETTSQRQANSRVAARLVINKYNARFRSLIARVTGQLTQAQIDSINQALLAAETILTNAESGTLTAANLATLDSAVTSASTALTTTTTYVSILVFKLHFQITTKV
jgi:hypothetical protein